MENEKAQTPSSFKQGNVLIQGGQPLQFTDVQDAAAPGTEATAIPLNIAKTVAAYAKAARKLLEGKYLNEINIAPPHMRLPCDVLIVRCRDGILMRHDAATEGEGRVRYAVVKTPLAEIAPQFSDQIIHFPEDPSTYIPKHQGPEIKLKTTDAEGRDNEVARLQPFIYATTKLPEGFQISPPPTRPPCLVSLTNEIDIQIHGIILPAESPGKITDVSDDQFIAHAVFRFPVGWQTIEIYPPLPDEYWLPEYAPSWAELDLLATLAQKNALAATLRGIDSRVETRKRYVRLLEELEALLTGPEEPVHQFLKQHPELLCPTSERFWSKLPFGNRISDFVFREPHNDYLLVEIEAPIRELFRKDGQQREELTHAINQIADWVQYIGDNKTKVEDELGLVGISTNPRTLVVIGRSELLNEENRRKLTTLQAQQNKLRILTYDDLVATARANLERILGPLTLRGQNVELYFYRGTGAVPTQMR